VRSVVAVLLDILLPNRCAACAVPGSPLCLGCRDALIRLAPPLCGRCGSPGAWPVKRCAECSGRRIAFASARAAIVYDAAARRFVQAWKEHGQRRLAREAAAIMTETLSRPEAPVLAFVP
jgi:predicted amidophosphoribosyltransferase